MRNTPSHPTLFAANNRDIRFARTMRHIDRATAWLAFTLAALLLTLALIAALHAAERINIIAAGGW